MANDPTYIKFKSCFNIIRVVNDTAERGIGLISDFNDVITKNEDQKQSLLKVVAKDRKENPSTSKQSLFKTKYCIFFMYRPKYSFCIFSVYATHVQNKVFMGGRGSQLTLRQIIGLNKCFVRDKVFNILNPLIITIFLDKI